MTTESIARCSRSAVRSMLVLAAMVVALPVWAQQTEATASADWQHGTTLVGFGGVQSASSNVSAAAGAGFGWEVTRQFSLEGRATWFNVNGGLSDFAATFAAHVPLATARPLVPFVSAGVGVYRASFDSTSTAVPSFYLNRMPVGVPVTGSRSFQDFLVTLGGGVNVFLSNHFALRPEANLMLVTDWSDTRRVGVYGVQLVYHIEQHPIE
jgi:Outer membrane protein beta-barrel domain